MEMRDRLIELINDCRSMDGYGMDLVEKQADYLLANGVIVPSCKVGNKENIVLPDTINSIDASVFDGCSKEEKEREGNG